MIKIFLALLLISLTSIFAQENPVKELQKEIEIPVKIKPFIAVSDISEKSVTTLGILNEISEATTPTEHIEEIHESIPSYIESIETLLIDPQYKNLKILNIRKLQQLQSELLIYSTGLAGWKKSLKSKIEIYNQNRALLKEESALWDETKLNADKEDAPEAIQEQINSIIIGLNELENTSKEEYDFILTDLNAVTKKILEIETMVELLKEAETESSNDIFSQNSLPIFDVFKSAAFSPLHFFNSVKINILERYNESKHYFQTQSTRLYTFATLFVLITLFVTYFNYLYSKRKLFVKESSWGKKDFYFMKMPVATLVVLLSLVLVIVFPDRPSSVIQFLLLVLIIPVARVTQTVIAQEYRKFLYLFLLLYSFEFIRFNAITSDFETRLYILFLGLGLLYYLFTVIRNSVLDFITNRHIRPLASKMLNIFILLLLISIVSNLYGAVLLSARILDAVFITIYSALIFYSMYIVLSGYIIVIFRRRIDSTSHIMEKYSQKIESTTIVIIKIAMFLWWLKVLFVTLSLYPYLLEYLEIFMKFSWSISSTVISVESIVDFVAIVIGTWMVAKLVITILNVEVFARFTFPRGVPTAITTTLNYFIVISGTIIALSSLGITPEQFTLVFGALGVGIGFGLRNIIANFVSGIIMVFERPVQISDTIEVNGTLGSVQSIGARSTTIKTFDGSEVIIPNADFIAKDITNWTLSDEYRRKIVVFKVDYNSDLEEVLQIMKDVAVSHPDVLKDPEPLAIFVGFGENYIEFKLYFWLTENLIVAPSEVSIGIYRALKEANIKMPMPKQETYLKKIEE